MILHFALVGAVVLATSFMSGVFGMAGGMVLMGVLLLLMPVPAAMMLHGVTQMASNGWRALLWRRYIRWDLVGRYAVGLVLAAGLFAWLRFVPDEATVLIVLGLSPFVALAIPQRYVVQADHRLGAEACGALSTAFQFLSGVSGPILDLFFVRSTLDRRAVVATKAACQTITHLAKLAYFGSFVAGGLEAASLAMFAMAVGLAMAGASLGRIVLERISDVQFRRWTRGVVMLIGAVYLVQGIGVWAAG